ncbi:MAG: N-acetylglucosamine-6-phosphate deacetylase [Ruminococcaceae bacterium]|nr:N-acetylglucosamine-6-phosphate deacetylase [Oscillospiraceae bacterium]
MDTIFWGASVYDTDSRTFIPRNVVVRDGTILAVTDDCGAYPDAERIDCSGLYLIPGLVDVHTHGRVGLDFTGASTGDATKDSEKLDQVMLSYARTGTTSVMVTLASAPIDSWIETAAFLADYAHSEHKGANIPGLHLEGNFLSFIRRGAHAADLLCAPSADVLDRIADLSKGLCLHASIAPELDGSDAFLKEALRRGVSVGIAHSDATFEQAVEAVRKGANTFTHTFNAMSPLHHRMPGCVGAALLTDEAYAELICDGFHSHPATACLLKRTKPADKLILITDSMEAAGLSDGEYSIAGIPVFVKNGQAVNSEGAIAGSTISLFDGLCNFMRFTGTSLEDAIPAATANPAQMIGAYEKIGSVAAGKRADFLLVENKDAPVLKSVICGGVTIE